MSFLLPLINISSIWTTIQAIFFSFLLAIDSAVYLLVAYSFKVFQLMCTVNFNNIMGIASGIINAFQAVIIVFIVYVLGAALIKGMLNPDKAQEDGKKILINIFITAALLVSYNTIFGVMNELNIALVGNATGYEYIYLEDIFDVTKEDGNGEKDKGIIMNLLFDGENIGDPGQSIAVDIAGSFIRDHDSDSYTILKNALCSGGGCDMSRLSSRSNHISIPDEIAEDRVDYTWLLGIIVAGFVVYSVFKASLQIGIRMFKLMILQMLAPLAIIDIIQHGFDGKMKKFLETYFKVFIDAFMRMLTLMIVTVFVSKFLIHIGQYFPGLDADESWFTKILIKLIIVIAAYMFAGEAPKFINQAFGLNLNESGGFGKTIRGLVGAGVGGAVGLVTGAATGGLKGAVVGAGSGLVNGAKEGSKGEKVADLFKTGKGVVKNARDANSNMLKAGGIREFAKARVQGKLGIPQRMMEQGKLAEERRGAMDDMIKTMEENYDRKINYKYIDPVTGKTESAEIGIDRDKYRDEAYKYNVKKDKFDGQFESEMSYETKQAIKDTSKLYDAYSSAQSAYEAERIKQQQSGVTDEARLKQYSEAVESTRTAYQAAKSSTDKKIDTEFDAMMIRDMKKGNYTDSSGVVHESVKKKGRHAVAESIETYDNVASPGYSTKELSGQYTDGNGLHNTQTTKNAKDEYTLQQDQTKHSHEVTRYNNSNSRGSGDK